MAMNFATLTGAKTVPGSIKAWANYEKLDAAGALAEAEAYIYGVLRAREMRSATTLSLAADALSVALPARFLEPIALTVRPDGDRVAATSEANLRHHRWADTTGRPALFAIWAEAFQFDVAAEEALTLDLVFYDTPAPLAGDNPTNFLTTRYPGLLRAACLMGAADQMDDDAAYARRKGRLDELLARAAVEQDYGRGS